MRRPDARTMAGRPTVEVLLLLLVRGERAHAVALAVEDRCGAGRPATVLALVLAGEARVLSEHVALAGEVQRGDDPVALHSRAQREAEGIDHRVRERGAP